MDNSITLTINARAVHVAQGTTVAAAIARSGNGTTRRSVTGMPRAPVCGMGVCQECRVNINGRDHQLACQTLCAPGMEVVTA